MSPRGQGTRHKEPEPSAEDKALAVNMAKAVTSAVSSLGRYQVGISIKVIRDETGAKTGTVVATKTPLPALVEGAIDAEAEEIPAPGPEVEKAPG